MISPATLAALMSALWETMMSLAENVHDQLTEAGILASPDRVSEIADAAEAMTHLARAAVSASKLVRDLHGS